MDLMSDATTAVQVSGLTKVFKGTLVKGAFTAVRDVSFNVRAGEVYGLIGPNGSGKSTTMKVILGLLAPTKGTTSIFGKSSTEVVSRRDVGFLPENPYFYKHLTGMETLLFYGRLCGLSGAALKSRAQEMLALTGLESAADRRVGGFSKGMLQRLGLAQALIHDPRLLVLDEPTAGVDPAGSRKIRDLILEMKRRGLTVLVTSHLLEQMQEVCDRVGIMAHGNMVREGRLDELTAVENQTEITLENADPALLARIEQLVSANGGGARLVSSGKPRTTLERLFLEATAEGEK
ncbi:MAG: ABC transporter ATP-binding protein [Verrucomicrobiaceae bacterium]|jgi:ABC-2 type transport system ATP-binding protein|nr:ABC transporter ATP-binding protein [Verrucomicrobiaceae bacterium]